MNIIRFKIKYIAAIFSLCLSVSVKAQLHIIPQPLHLTEQKGAFILSGKAVIGVNTCRITLQQIIS
jgi:hexosaminidase